MTKIFALLCIDFALVRNIIAILDFLASQECYRKFLRPFDKVLVLQTVDGKKHASEC